MDLLKMRKADGKTPYGKLTPENWLLRRSFIIIIPAELLVSTGSRLARLNLLDSILLVARCRTARVVEKLIDQLVAQMNGIRAAHLCSLRHSHTDDLLNKLFPCCTNRFI